MSWSNEMDVVEISGNQESEDDEVQMVADDGSFEEPLNDEDRGGLPGNDDGKWAVNPVP